MTRWNRVSPLTGFSTGAPSIGTRIAGELLTITCGGTLLTGTVDGLIPAAASEASRRSSAMLRTWAATSFCSSAAYAEPRSGNAGKLLFVMFRFSNTTIRVTRSTWVRAVAKITPNDSSLAPTGLMATADRNDSWLPSHLSICGW